jgi:Domain of unknown function (DUF4160)
MPEICRFHGIIIKMYYMYLGVERDAIPNFHAICSGNEALIGIDPIVLLKGALPFNALEKVSAWAKINQPGLKRNWELLLDNKAAISLPPLAPLE